MRPLSPFLSFERSDDVIGALEIEYRFSSSELDLCQRLLAAGLPPLVRPEILSLLFGVSHRLILSMSYSQSVHYRVFQKPKNSGGTRQIEAPRRYLKLVQRWLNSQILSKQLLPEWVYGFALGRNIFDNARHHIPSKNLMVVDIEDFFPSVTAESVENVFRNFAFPSQVAHRLMRLCTFDERLPQGAPTSPALANIVFSDTDTILHGLAEQWDCVYTRYADDLAFSGARSFSDEDIREVTQVLGAAGFRANRSKSRIVGSGSRQVIAGIVVNTSGLPPRSQRKRWRAAFHEVARKPESYLGHGKQLSGIAAFVNQYDSQLATRYWSLARRVQMLEQEQ